VDGDDLKLVRSKSGSTVVYQGQSIAFSPLSGFGMGAPNAFTAAKEC
jgi:hypothetical protein